MKSVDLRRSFCHSALRPVFFGGAKGREIFQPPRAGQKTGAETGNCRQFWVGGKFGTL